RAGEPGATRRGQREHGRFAHGRGAQGDAGHRAPDGRRGRHEPARSQDDAQALRREGVSMRYPTMLLLLAACCTFHNTYISDVGGSTDEVKENLVRPACRSIGRDVLNAMTSEEFYVSEKRFLKAEEAREKLARVLAPEGVIVERVILGEHHFHPDYEKVIHDKKLAEQTAERMVSEGHAAQQEALRNLETAKGQVSQKIAAARGSLDQVKLHADAD